MVSRPEDSNGNISLEMKRWVGCLIIAYFSVVGVSWVCRGVGSGLGGGRWGLEKDVVLVGGSE